MNTFFSFLLPAEETAKGIQILADMAFRSKFDPTDLNRERVVIFRGCGSWAADSSVH